MSIAKPRIFLFIFIILILCPLPLSAKKTDIVILGNGDRITGEIKKLEFGMLKYSTDDMGTIGIEWDHVDFITSTDSFEVELQSGEKFYGRIVKTDMPRKMAISGARARGVLDMSLVVGITPLEKRFLDRVKGSFSLGYSFAKANSSTQFTLNADINYRTNKYNRRLTLDSFLDDRDDVDRSTRNSAELTLTRFLGMKWLGSIVTGYEQNDELDLDMRINLGAEVGRKVINTNMMTFIVNAGLSATWEEYGSTDSLTTNLEATFRSDFRIFKYDDPKTDLHTFLYIFPNITTPGRIRLEFEFDIDYELIKDFYISFTIFEKYDSEPPSADAEQHDNGLTTAIEYKFK